MLDNTSSEIELLQASVKGSAIAFEVIVKKYQSLVCAITFSATADVDKSEELAHEAFIKAWANLAQLRDLTKFRAWLCRIAQNIIRNYIRQIKRDIVSRATSIDEMGDISSEGVKPVRTAVNKEQQAVISQALKQIPERYRTPLVLFYRQEESIKEVAEQLGLSEEAARTRISRGRKMLKERVATMVETTISRTGPGKAFTTAVIASITTLAVKGSGVAAAAGVAAASTAGATSGISAIMSGVTAKIITAAAVVAVGVGAVVTYKHFTKPSHGPEFSQVGIVAQEQGSERDRIREEATGQSSDGTDIFFTLPAKTNNLDTKKTTDLTAEVTEKTDKNSSAILEAGSIPVQTEDKLIVGGFIKSEDGKPIADVDVELLWDVKRDMPMFEGSSAVTDSDGRWECQITGESEDILIRLKHPDYLSQFFDYRPSFDDLLARSAVLIMRKGLQISGFVFDIDGYPVPDALIMPPESITGTDGVYGIQDSAKTTRSDANGYFFLGAVEPGLQDIAIDANGYAPTFVDINITPEISPIEISLDYGKNLTGIVVDVDGEPLPGVRVTVDQWQVIQGRGTGNFSHKTFHMLRRRTITDTAGQYTIEHLPSIGDVEMSFVKDSHFLSSYIQNNMTQEENKVVTMYPVPTITGTVIDDYTEKPITEFEIIGGCSWEPNSIGSWDLNADKITSIQGNFSKTKSNFAAHTFPSPGWVAVKINSKGYLQAQSPWMRIDQEFSPITIRLKKTQILRSTLFYSSGVVVSNVDVVLVDPSSLVYVRNGKLDEGIINSKYQVTQTDPNGYFEFSAPAVPTKILVLDYNEYLVADTNGLKDKMTLTPWAYVTGLVETDNDINSNIIVRIAPEYDPNAQIRWVSEQTANVDGRFEFFYIPAIPQETHYGSANSTNALNKGPEINPHPNQELELRLGTIQPVDSNITSTEKSRSRVSSD